MAAIEPEPLVPIHAQVIINTPVPAGPIQSGGRWERSPSRGSRDNRNSVLVQIQPFPFNPLMDDLSPGGAIEGLRLEPGRPVVMLLVRVAAEAGWHQIVPVGGAALGLGHDVIERR